MARVRSIEKVAITLAVGKEVGMPSLEPDSDDTTATPAKATVAEAVMIKPKGISFARTFREAGCRREAGEPGQMCPDLGL